jgi:hypothetical protein
MLIFPSVLSGQQVQFNFDKESVTGRIKTDIYTLAGDSFMGREAGTKGEILAMNYITSKFEEACLSPYFGDTSYHQAFSNGQVLSHGKNNHFGVDKHWYRLAYDFYPVVYSGNDTTFGEMSYVGYGITAPEHDDYAGKLNLKNKIFVIELSIPGGYDTSSKFISYSSISYKIALAIKNGANGIIFINSDKFYTYEPVKLQWGFKQYPVAVIYFRGTLEELFPEDDKYREAYIFTEIKRDISDTSYNVAGYINNQSPFSVVIGAHYDHIGYGGESSRIRRSKEIHNGADDNASGTAAMLEIGRYLKSSGNKKYNYILVAFSAEEKGLIGAKHFANTLGENADQVNYMINLDMLGRLDTHYRIIEVWAAGSSKKWKEVLKDDYNSGINLKIIDGSIGNSDHSPFYKKHIPAIFFITGVHSDYHKPSDDASKINFSGEADIIDYLEHFIAKMDSSDKINYQKVGFFSSIGAVFYSIDELINIGKE